MGWCHEFGPQIREDCGHPMTAGETSCYCSECGVVCTGRFAGCVSVWRRGPRPVSTITFSGRREPGALAGEGPLVEAASARKGGGSTPAMPPPMVVAPANGADHGVPAVEHAHGPEAVVAESTGPEPEPADGDGGRARPFVGAGVPLRLKLAPPVAGPDSDPGPALEPEPEPELFATAPETEGRAGVGAVDHAALAILEEEPAVPAPAPMPSEPAPVATDLLPEPARPDVAVRFVVEKLSEYGEQMRGMADVTASTLAGYGAEQEKTAADLREMLSESTQALSRFGASLATITAELTSALAELTSSASRTTALASAIDRMQAQLADLADRLDDMNADGSSAASSVAAAADNMRLAIAESTKSLDRLSGTVGAISTDLGAVLGDTVEGALGVLDEVRTITHTGLDANRRVLEGLDEVRALREEIGLLRADLAELAEEEAAAPAPAVAAPAPAALPSEALDEILGEIQALRRRLPIGGPRRAVKIDDDQVAYLVEAVVEATVTSLTQAKVIGAPAPPPMPAPRVAAPRASSVDEPGEEEPPRPRRRPRRPAQASSQPGDASSK